VIDNSSFERAEQFKYLETTLSNQNSIQEEIKSRSKSGNVSYQSMKYPLSSSLLWNSIKIKIYKAVISPVVFGVVAHNEGRTQVEGVWE
jgi:hypothetical protein